VRETVFVSQMAIDLCAEVAPVRVVVVPGNHDRHSCVWLWHVVDARYRGYEGVSVVPWNGSYVAVRYGRCLVGIHHADGVSQTAQLAQLMADTWPVLWGETRWRYWMTGHYHHAMVETLVRKRTERVSTRKICRIHEDAGVTRIQMSSLSGDDRYHVHKGYTGSRPQLMGVCLDHDRGWFMDAIGVLAA
jgi:hypothetical protein